ncbi:MAG: hypothetical protein DCF25_02165 [Leptolyngbya foveolarum]|uniref:DUF4381 domain-containing protein n=1 Tax=Leptolyngbya foveolarum TaxID=47253 RepID=A0A2W4V0V4_9CYAN|nr:MAG: hypothetical protein DCF25_02165 [Leptolyngbya foveolarum]
MDNAHFDPAHWSHWLLIACFLTISAWGLMLSWQWSAVNRTRRKWNQRLQAERRRTELARQLAVDSPAVLRSLPKVMQLSAARDALRK